MLFPVIGALFLLLAVYTWFANPYDTSKGFPKFMFGMTAAMVLFSIMAIARWRGFYVSVSVTDQAVNVNGNDFRFERIDAVGVTDRPITAYGQRENNAWRTLTITAEGKTKTWTWLSGVTDTVPAVVQTLVDRMADQARRRTIHGKGWTLEQTTLRTNEDATPLSTLSGAGVFDREVRLWRHGESEPFFAVPAGSPNALVLLQLASSVGAPAHGRSEPALPRAAAPTNDDLGRLLFTRKPSGLVNTFVAIVYGLFGMAMAWYAGDHYAPQLTRPLIIAAAVVGVFYLLRALHSFTIRYRFHERGVIASALFAGRRDLRYGDVRGMKWGETRAYVKGIYTGTTTKARLVPADGRPLRIRARHYRTPDDDLDRVRDAIAANLADGLQQRLQLEGRVTWIRGVTLLHDGVELKRGTVVRYDEPINIRFSGGFMHFFRGSWRRPLRMLTVGEENFFPGYALYRRLAKQVQYTA